MSKHYFLHSFKAGIYGEKQSASAWVDCYEATSEELALAIAQTCWKPTVKFVYLGTTKPAPTLEEILTNAAVSMFADGAL